VQLSVGNVCGRDALRRSERMRVRVIELDGRGAAALRMSTLNLEGASILGMDGNFSCTTGPPPRGCIDRAPEIVDDIEIGAIVAALTDVASLGADCAIRYTHVVRSGLLAKAQDTEPTSMNSAVWALAGHHVTRKKRKVAIGESGRGTGLERLGSAELLDVVRWRLAATDRSEPMMDYVGPAVLNASAAAVLSHEAVGHFAEADEAVDNCLRHRLGCRIASETLVYWDDPLTADGIAHSNSTTKAFAAKGQQGSCATAFSCANSTHCGHRVCASLT
jgi:TldD protein